MAFVGETVPGVRPGNPVGLLAGAAGALFLHRVRMTLYRLPPHLTLYSPRSAR